MPLLQPGYRTITLILDVDIGLKHLSPEPLDVEVGCRNPRTGVEIGLPRDRVADEGEMGVTYEELDAMLESGKLNKRVKKMVKASAHKREGPAVFKVKR